MKQREEGELIKIRGEKGDGEDDKWVDQAAVTSDYCGDKGRG